MKNIEKALGKSELVNFLRGDNNYKLHQRNENADINDFMYCWDSEIIPFSKLNNSIGTKLGDALYDLLLDVNNVEINIYTTVNTLFWYYYHRNNGRIDFNIPLCSIEKKLKEQIKLNKNKLTSCQKWAGETWNSNDGLWSPIQKIAVKIRDEYHGINFVIEDEIIV